MSEYPTIVLASGSFDPLHAGHIAYLKAAKELGDVLVVAIKGNEAIDRKKMRHFMNEEERKSILESLKYIDKVVIVEDINSDNMLVAAKAIDFVAPHIYATGEKELPPAFVNTCEAMGVEIKYRVGGPRIRSSSELLKEYNDTNWEL